MALPSDIYGSRVGQIPLPDPYGDLQNVIPGLPGLNTAASGAILSKLKGQLSPETLAMMQNYQASTATRSGMPGSNVIPGSLGFNRSLRDLGRTVEDTQSKGLSELLPFLQTTSNTQTVNQALQYERNLQNQINIASPEPAAAGQHAEELFNKYLELLTGPAGGTRGAGMPTYSYGPRTPASFSRPTTNTTTNTSPQRSITGASGVTSGWDGRPSGANQYGGIDLLTGLAAPTPGSGSWESSGAPPGTFYAGGAEGPDPNFYPGWELDTPGNTNVTTTTPESSALTQQYGFDPLDYLLGLGLLN